MGILSGLEKMGFKSMGKVDLFEEEKKNVERPQKKKKEAAKQLTEEDLLYEKSITCPICQNEFKIKAVVGSKAKRELPDIDMRPRYVNIDTLKYDAIVCRKCGFAALTSYFKESLITDNQLMLIQENVTANYKPQPISDSPTYTYDEAIDNHKLVLLNDVVKKAKASEKAYVCLKTAWLYRGKKETYSSEAEDYESVVEECSKEENEYLLEAKKGFVYALGHESGKICGMEPSMVEYLCAAISYETGEVEEAQRMISRLIANPATSTQLKERCHDLKSKISEEQ